MESGSNVTCYHPDGTASTKEGLFACDPTGEKYGHCCVEGDECTTNGLCMNANVTNTISKRAWYWRESCTDKDWGPTCPKFCIGSGTDTAISAAGIDWAVMACSEDTFCCSRKQAFNSDMSQYDCCDDPKLVNTWGKAEHLAGAVAFTTQFPTSSSSVPSTSTSTSVPASTTAITSSSATATGNRGSQGLSESAKVGIGVGVSLGVVCLVLLGALLWLLGKRRGKKKYYLDQARAPSISPVNEAQVSETNNVTVWTPLPSAWDTHKSQQPPPETRVTLAELEHLRPPAELDSKMARS